jgi:hypothetical protein
MFLVLLSFILPLLFQLCNTEKGRERKKFVKELEKMCQKNKVGTWPWHVLYRCDTCNLLCKDPGNSKTEAIHRSDCVKCRNNAELLNQCLNIPCNWDNREDANTRRKRIKTRTHTHTQTYT